jgi:hypothetical protein
MEASGLLRAAGATLVVALVAGCGGSESSSTPSARQPSLAPPAQRVLFGHIGSLRHEGTGYVLRFDPAWFLSGVTANSAASEDGAVEPGQPVPNDNYVVDESHRLFTYLLPAKAHVTVLTRHGDPASVGATPITVAELARIVNGGRHRPLFEPLETGVWIRIRSDTVLSLDQQYRP